MNTQLREDLDRLARETADASLLKQRLRFQVLHPHYTPPPHLPKNLEEEFADGHRYAKKYFAKQGQLYSRDYVWAEAVGSSLGEMLDRFEVLL